MNSSLMLHDPADAGIHTPNYVFVADQLQQRILCSNMASPHFVLTQESSEADLYQAYLNSPSTSILQLKNIKEDLVDAMVKANESAEGHLFRFRDENGYWRFGFLENTLLYGGEAANQEFLCGMITRVQNPAAFVASDSSLSSRLVWMTDQDLRLTKVSGDCRTLGFDIATLLATGQLSFLTEETGGFLDSICQDLFVSPKPETRSRRPILLKPKC